MRRITSLFALLAMLMVSMSAMAQDTYLDELKAKTFSISSQVEEIVPDTWYIVYQNRDGGGYLFDSGVDNRALKGPMSDVQATGNVATEKAKYLIRFIEGESSDESCAYPTYYLQFGTGHWIGDGTDYPIIAEDKDEACCWNVGQMDENNKGHFWFTLDYLKDRIDNDAFSGGTATMAYWETGPSTSVGGNCDWAVYSIEFQQGDELQMLKDQVYNRLQALLAYYDSFTPGTEVGQYDATAVKAFQDALDDVTANFENKSFTFTMENLQAMLDKMNETYEAVQKAQNKLANGYYFVQSAASFYLSTMEGEEEVRTAVKKAIYDNASGTGWTTFSEETADLSFLFRVDYDEETGYYEFSNMATKGKMPQLSWGWDFNLDASISLAESEVDLRYFGKDDDGHVEYSIRRADQSGDYEFAYINGYYSGAGVSGTLCAWTEGAERGAWAFLPVEQYTVDKLIEAYQSVYEHEALVAKYKELKAKTEDEMAVAQEMANLVTDASQFSSPWTEPYEGAIEYLLDNDYSTYWHSCWSDGTCEMDKHYLQVALPDPLEGGLKMTFVRRDHGSNQVTDFILKASNTSDADDDSWAELGHFLFDDTSTGVLFTSDPITYEGSYQYFRIYPHITVGDESMVGFWHAAEINFLPAVANPNAQAGKMGNLFTDLQTVLAEQADLTDEQINKDVYDKLQAAVDAFHTKFVDPRPLRTAISAAKKNIANVVEGSDPGYWSDTTTKTSLQTVVDDAASYDSEGNYTATQTGDYLTKVTEGNEAMMAAANKVQIGKWYQIQFPSEEMFEDHEWSTGSASVYVWGDLTYAEALFDKVITLGTLVEGDGTSTASGYFFPEYIKADEAYQGTYIVSDDLADLDDEDLSLFRFVPYGDSYLIQNKATGLYINMTGTSSTAVADIQPSLFKVSAIGTGVNVIKADGLDGTDYAYMHLAQFGSDLVSWDASTLGSNSAFLIKEKGDITTLPGNDFVKGVEAGKIYAMCYAPSFKVTGAGAQIYTVKGLKVEGEEYSVVLTPVEEAPAGQPVILIADGEYEESDDPDYVEVDMEHGTEFVTQPLKANCIIGSYAKQSAPAGYIVANGDGFDCVKKSTSVGCNSAYLAYQNGSVDDAEGDLVVVVGGKGTVVDSVEKVMNKVAASGAVYSIDGRLLLENGNINSVRQFGKGMYIVNGVKVLVR